MNNIVKTFMKRDGMSESEANREYELLREDVIQAAEDGYYMEAEDYLLDAGFDLDDMIDLLI